MVDLVVLDRQLFKEISAPQTKSWLRLWAVAKYIPLDSIKFTSAGLPRCPPAARNQSDCLLTAVAAADLQGIPESVSYAVSRLSGLYRRCGLIQCNSRQIQLQRRRR